jgi:hypothetical protein
MGFVAMAIEDKRRERKADNRERAQIKRDKLKVKHLASIAGSLEVIAGAVADEDGALVLAIQHFSTVVKQDVTRALNNAAFRPGRGERKKK